MFIAFCLFLPITLATTLVGVWSNFEKSGMPAMPSWMEKLNNKTLFWVMLALFCVTAIAGFISGAVGTLSAGWSTFHSVRFFHEKGKRANEVRFLESLWWQVSWRASPWCL
jgi:hypothetical protein